MQLKDIAVVITGGGSGLGAATAGRTFGALEWARPEVVTVCSARL